MEGSEVSGEGEIALVLRAPCSVLHCPTRHRQQGQCGAPSHYPNYLYTTPWRPAMPAPDTALIRRYEQRIAAVAVEIAPELADSERLGVAYERWDREAEQLTAEETVGP